MKEIKNDLNSVKDDLNSVKNDLSSFNETVKILKKSVSSLSGNLEDYKQQTAFQLSDQHNTQTEQLTQLYTIMDTLDSKLDAVNASMTEELRAMESQLEEHQTQTTLELAGLQSKVTSELAGLQRNVTSELTGLHASLQSNTQQLTQLSTDADTKLDIFDSKLDAVNASMREELRDIESQFEEHQMKTTSVLAELQSNVTSELTGLHASSTQQLSQLSTDVDTLDSKLNILDSKLDAVNASMREQLRDIESQFEEHQIQTTSELAESQRNVTSELTGLHASLQSSTQQLSTDVDTLDSKLDSKLDAVNATMKEQLRDIESQLVEHQMQTTSELAELQRNVTLELCGLHASLQSSTHQLFTDVNTLDSKLDILDSKLDAVNASMREQPRDIESQLEEHQMQTTSELTELQRNVTSELSGLHASLQSSTQQLFTDVNTLDSKMDILDSKLDAVNASMREQLRDIESQHEQHQMQTTSGLAELLNNVTSELTGLHASLQSSTQQLTQLSIDVDTDSKLDSVNASIREELRAIESQLEGHQTLTSELAGLHTSLQSNSQQLTHLSTDVYTLNSKLDVLNASMREGLRAIESQLEEHQTQTTSELAGLHTSLHFNIQQLSNLSNNVNTLDSKLEVLNASMREELRAIETQLEMHETQTGITLAGLHSFLQSNTHTKLTEISTKMDTLDSKLDSVNNSDILIRKDFSSIKEDLSSLNETMNRISKDVKEHDTHITTELTNIDQNLQQNFTLFGYVYSLSLFTCGGTGGWRRVVYLDMTDNNTNCPSGWQLTSYSKRTCGRVSTGDLTCDSVTFPVSGGEYNRVCGRIKGYQYGHTDAFEAYHDGEVTTIDGAYVTGVSLTHGSPRQHIQTFAAGTHEEDTDDEACPCDTTYNITIPPFVGGDYFCESGADTSSTGGFHPNDPLWDGAGCTATSTCCSFNSPPYFTKQLHSPTNDDIEARICNLDDSSDDVPIEFIELYVQ